MIKHLKNFTLNKFQTAILGVVFLFFVSLLFVEASTFVVSFISKGTLHFSPASLGVVWSLGVS